MSCSSERDGADDRFEPTNDANGHADEISAGIPPSREPKAGTVIGQKPKPGSRHPKGTKVGLTLSKGPKP
jgi:hypothetical protein